MNDDDKLKYLIKSYDDWKGYRVKNYDKRFIESYSLYKSYRDRNISDWQSNVFLPYVFGLIETIFPRVMQYLYQGDEFVKALPREMTDTAQAEIVNALIQYQIDTQIPNLFLEKSEMYKSCLIYGTGLGKLTQNVEKRRPEFTAIDIFDLVVQPFKKHIDEMDGVYHVYDKYVDSLYQMQQQGLAGYKNIEKLFNTSQSKEDETDKSKRNSNIGKDARYKDQRNTALIYEYWGKVPVTDRADLDAGYSTARYEDKLIMIANRKQIIREIPNPYATPSMPEGFKPFIAAKNYIDIGEFYAMGEVDAIKDLQHEANEMENNMLDNLKLIINRMWQVDYTAGIDLDTLYSYPGAIFQMNGLDKMKAIDHRDIPASYFNSRANMLQDIDKASGIFDYTRGANMPGMTDTVGGITSLIEEANMRFGIKLKVLQMTSVTDFARKLFMLDQIFIKGADLPIRIENEMGIEWLNINEDNISGLYDFKPVGVSMVGSKMARQNGLIRLAELFSKFPPIPPLADQILDEYEIKNKDEILNYLRMMWGMPPEGVQAPGLPGGQPPVPPQLPGAGGVSGVPLRSDIAAPPANNDAEMGQNLSKLLAAGAR